MSEFREDLRVWAQAAYNEWARRRRPTPSQLSQDINKLLRDRLAKSLKTKDGAAILAEFLRTPGRIVPSVPPVPLPMETGWLTFEDRVDGELPYVYTYTPTGLTKYTIVPEGITLDGYASYQSELTRTSYTPIKAYDPAVSALARHRPERYSGLTRLFVQALYGANRTIDEVLTGLDALTPSRAVAFWMGLVRSPDGEYWLVWLNRRSYLGGLYQSIRARHLSIPTEMADVAAAVRGWSGNMSAADANYLEAYLLSTLEYDASATNVILIPEGTSDLNDMYSTYWKPMPWGLCFRYQMRGASDEHTCGAVWTAKHDSDAGSPPYLTVFYNFRRAFIDITFTEGVPSATLTTSETARTELTSGLNPIRGFWTDLTTVSETFIASTAAEIDSELDPVTLTSWYGSDGSLHELSFYKATGELLDNTESSSGPICGTGTLTDTWTQEYTEGYVGFKLDGDDVVNPTTFQGYRNFSQVVSTSRVNLSTDFFPAITASGFSITPCNGESNPDGVTVYNMTRYKGDQQTSFIVSDSVTKSSDPALIISDIPGCAWVMCLGTPDTIVSSASETQTATGGGLPYQ